MADLLNAVEATAGGVGDYTADDLIGDWGDLDIGTDAWLATDRSGRLAGYAAVEGHGGTSYQAEIEVLPDDRGRGLGGALLATVEARVGARLHDAPAGARVVLAGHVRAATSEASWAERRGYAVVRRLDRMTITLTEPPGPPAWPAGITVRTFRPRDERAVFDALSESFADHWGSVPMEYDAWARRFERPDFDPSLWFLAMDGDEVVGTSLGSVNPESGGWVRGVGVRRRWRRRGIARALMLETFGAFWARGIPTIGLGVDSTSLTGATDLYIGLGMRVTESYLRVEKEMRPGRDLATRSLG